MIDVDSTQEEAKALGISLEVDWMLTEVNVRLGVEEIRTIWHLLYDSLGAVSDVWKLNALRKMDVAGRLSGADFLDETRAS
jgi:hypothetical protein